MERLNDRQRQIVAAALAIVGERGLEALTMKNIAARVGFSDAAVYRHFRDKSSLLEAMVVRSEESATDALEYFARGENQLRKKLDGWGLVNTKYDPRTSTASELLNSLELLNTGTALNRENTQYLLNLMDAFTENDQILLGKFNTQLPECEFQNKRGTMLNPTIVADMGILKCGENSWYLVVAGTPSVDSTATFEDIQASIERFAAAFAGLVK